MQVEQDEQTYLRMQLPLNLPITKPVENTKAKDTSEGSKTQETIRQRSCRLNELPVCHLGKLRVYKSGAVKLHIGDVVYNVSTFISSSLK